MKKALSVLGIVAAVVTFSFFLDSNIKAKSDIKLAELIVLSHAFAEGTATVPCYDVPPGTEGGVYARKCDGCVWFNCTCDYQGTCTYDY